MKRFSLLLASALMIASYSCNNGEEAKKEEPKPADTTAKAEAPQPPAFSPWKVLIIKHMVKDYAKWLPIYKDHDSARMKFGISQYIIGRGLDDSNMVIVLDKIEDFQRAKDFSKTPDLKSAMQKAGVTGQPAVEMANVIRQDMTDIPQKDRLMVSHHVKDFDAWLKVFDGEGKDARASYGLVERAISRGADDSNMVYIVFAVTDLEKAKARAKSPELKKLMDSAGVDGPPKALFYKIVDMVK